MALFSFNFDLPSEGPEVAGEPTQQVVVLQHGTETVVTPYADVEGMQIKDVFSRHASALGIDSSRRISYMSAGSTVVGTQLAQPGFSYRATVTSESKGA